MSELKDSKKDRSNAKSKSKRRRSRAYKSIDEEPESTGTELEIESLIFKLFFNSYFSIQGSTCNGSFEK